MNTASISDRPKFGSVPTEILTWIGFRFQQDFGFPFRPEFRTRYKPKSVLWSSVVRQTLTFFWQNIFNTPTTLRSNTYLNIIHSMCRIFSSGFGFGSGSCSRYFSVLVSVQNFVFLFLFSTGSCRNICSGLSLTFMHL